MNIYEKMLYAIATCGSLFILAHPNFYTETVIERIIMSFIIFIMCIPLSILVRTIPEHKEQDSQSTGSTKQ